MNTLLSVGTAIFLGLLGGKLLQKFKVPKVVGYIVVGVIMGGSVLGIFQERALENFTPLIDYTLGIIGFLIGAELKSEVFKKHGKAIYFILISEGMLAFAMVFAAVTLLTKKAYLGLLFGAIASATDPASTVNVLWEYKSRGPLTTTLTSIVALDDGLALILYGLVSVFSRSMITNESCSLWGCIGSPLLELGKCIVIGAVAGVILVSIIRKFEKESVLAVTLGMIAVIVGLSVYFNLDLILTSMVLGAFVVNVEQKTSEGLFKKVQELTTPFYMFFFVFVGASLNIRVFTQVAVLSIVVTYLVSRSMGKIFGAMFGAYLSKAKKTVAKYSGICLFTQGGVAIGLAMSIAHNLGGLGTEGAEVKVVIVSVVAATTFVVQLVGPIFVKCGITKADEVWRNITEEDIIDSCKVSDMMRSDFSVIKENDKLEKIIEIIKERESYHFPVVNAAEKLIGLISLGSLRDAFSEEQLNDIVLAKDIAVPINQVLYKEEPLKEALDIFNRRDIDYLPVVDDAGSNKIIGILEYKPLVEEINKRLFERQQSLEAEVAV